MIIHEIHNHSLKFKDQMKNLVLLSITSIPFFFFLSIFSINSKIDTLSQTSFNVFRLLFL